MSLVFDPISSPGATRDLFVDLSEALELDEVLTVATVVSGYPTVLTISDVAVNAAEVAYGEQTVAIGKGVHFSVQTLLESHAAVPITVSFEGDSGTSDKCEFSQPIVPSLCL